MELSCCWHKEQIIADECPYIGGNEQELLYNRKKRFVARCLECPRFLSDLKAMRSESDGLANLFPYVIEEFQALRVEHHTQAGLIESRNREIKFLHEVSLVLQTSVDMDEVIAMALTAVTAGKGFGLNRAILLLVDKERQNLKGYFALGPRRREEAGPIWREIEQRDLTLREMAQNFFESKMAAERERFDDLLELLSVPLSSDDHLFVRTLNAQTSAHITDLQNTGNIDQPQAKALGVNEMILVPLISKNRRIGLLLADNIVNHHPITTEDLHSLETFALPVSFAIERAALYERLQEELKKLTDANRRLKEQQEQILRMEKMALVGKLASNIAHSIRNPLTIIGGFARSLLKATPAEDAKHQYIESIIRESRKLEEVLEEVLNYAESLHPTFDLWDLNQLVTNVCAAFQDDFGLSGIDCELKLASGLPLVRIDFKKMAYCLRNMLNNAMEALPRGGRVTLTTQRSGDQVLLTLADDGPGMSPETLQEATTPFFTTKEKGSGLGLSLCSRILEGQGARLQIQSQEGRGTCFTVSLDVP